MPSDTSFEEMAAAISTPEVDPALRDAVGADLCHGPRAAEQLKSGGLDQASATRARGRWSVTHPTTAQEHIMGLFKGLLKAGVATKAIGIAKREAAKPQNQAKAKEMFAKLSKKKGGQPPR